MHSSYTGDTLVIVHPDQALRGPEQKLRLQWELISGWSGPLFVLETDHAVLPASPAQTTYLEIIDVAVDTRESRGLTVLVPANPGQGRLDKATEKIKALISAGSHITLTGAFAEGAVAEIATKLHGACFEVSIDESTIWRQDIDPEADARSRARLAALMERVCA